jgi:hypothetical protein
MYVFYLGRLYDRYYIMCVCVCVIYLMIDIA